MSPVDVSEAVKPPIRSIVRGPIAAAAASCTGLASVPVWAAMSLTSVVARRRGCDVRRHRGCCRCLPLVLRRSASRAAPPLPKTIAAPAPTATARASTTAAAGHPTTPATALARPAATLELALPGQECRRRGVLKRPALLPQRDDADRASRRNPARRARLEQRPERHRTKTPIVGGVEHPARAPPRSVHGSHPDPSRHRREEG